MDPDEIWRLALLERSRDDNGQGPRTVVQKDSRDANVEDDFDVDNDLLRDAPYAFDAAPAMPNPSEPLPILSHHSGAQPHTQQQQQHHQAHRSPSMQKSVADPAGAARQTERKLSHGNHGETRGVLSSPPRETPSFMLRGDRGTVRWVTAAGLSRNHRPRTLQSSSTSTNTETAQAAAQGGAGRDEWRDHAFTSSSGSDRDGSDDSDYDGHTGMGGGECGVSEVPLRPSRRPAHRSSSTTTRRALLGPDNKIEDLLAAVYAEQRREKAAALRRQGAAAVYDTTAEEELGLSTLEHDAATNRKTMKANTVTTTTAMGRQDAAPRAKSSGGELWVTKYTPRSFRELLSDETINLQLLRWLKSWDPYVFGPTAASPANSNAGQGITAAAEPPEERLALLAGPPGVGKTTLVHVLAAHCGYEVIEINASVERTATRLESVIKTAVSAAAAPPGGRHIPRGDGGRGSQSATTHHGGGDGKSRNAAGEGPRSLVEHLLTPKCLLIDEIDGIQSNVASLLLSLDLRRPVFCLCNDLYTPALRALRNSMRFIHVLPPIRPQRLLSRLEEICRREALPMDEAALADMVRASNGDVRSCLNSLQFLHRGLSVAEQQSEESSARGGEEADGGGDASTAATVKALYRRMQSKDKSRDVRDSWLSVFARADRTNSIQLLKKEWGYDYEGVIGAASAAGRRYQAAQALRRKRARDGVVDRPAADTETDLSRRRRRAGAGEEEEGSERFADALSVSADDAPVLGFRVDPAFIYASLRLGGGGAGVAGGGESTRASATDARSHNNNGNSNVGGSRAFLNGLQENYLDRPYTDYAFSCTTAAADGFAFQDSLSSLAFSSSSGSGAATSLIPFAEAYEAVTALQVFVSCSSSSAKASAAIRYPREDTVARQQGTEAQHIIREFREGCHTALTYPFLFSDESVSSDFCPLLLRSLFDSSVKFPLRPITDVAALPVGDQKLVRESVARHAAYGLTYKRVVLPSFPPSGSSSGGGGYYPRPMNGLPTHNGGFTDRSGRGGAFFANGEEGERREAWVLTPAIDTVGGVAGPMFSQPHRSPSYKSSVGLNNNNSSSSTSHGGIHQAGAKAGQQALPQMREEMKEVLVGEIRRYGIMARATAAQQSLLEHDGKTVEQQEQQEAKRQKVAKENIAPPPPRALDSRAAKASNEGDRERQATPHTTGTGTGTGAAVAPPPETQSTALAQPRQQPVRRDFFGRIIAAPAANSGTDKKGPHGARERREDAPSSGSPAAAGTQPANASSRETAPPQPMVKYVYQEGSTNAVKMPAVLADF